MTDALREEVADQNDAKTATGLPAVREDADTDALMTAWRDAEPEERAERLPAVERWSTMEAIARRIASSSLLPAALRSGPDREANVMVLLLTAHDLGISATTAMQQVHIIDGKPSMSAQLMRSLILRDGHGLQIKVEEDEAGKPVAATVRGWRKEMPDVDVDASYTWAEAVTAGLVGKDNWKRHPADMLVARATSRFARYFFPDCLSGVSYTPDELEAVPNLAQEREPERAPADEAQVALLEAGFATLSADGLNILREKWKTAKIGALRPTKHIPLIRADDVETAIALIAEAKAEEPADAEIVEPDPTRVPDGGGVDERQEADDSGEGFADSGDESQSPGVPSLAPPIASAADVPSPEPSLGNAAVKPAYGDGRPTETIPAPPCLGDADESPLDGPVTAATDGEALAVPDAALGLDGAREPDRKAHTLEAIEAEVAALSIDKVYATLELAGKAVGGGPKACRKRLVALWVSERPF